MRKTSFICSTMLALGVSLAALSVTPANAGEAGFTGMQIQGITKPIAQSLGLDEIKGVLVRDIDLGSPADKAGLRRGDLILKYAGQNINSFEQLIKVVGSIEPDQDVSISVLRKGETVKTALKTISRPENRRIAKGSFTNIPELGLTFAAMTEKVRKGFGLRWSSTGVVITMINAEKSAGMDLKRGEILLQIDQQDVWTPKQVLEKFLQAKKDGRKMLLLLVEGKEGERNGFRFSVMPIR